MNFLTQFETPNSFFYFARYFKVNINRIECEKVQYFYKSINYKRLTIPHKGPYVKSPITNGESGAFVKVFDRSLIVFIYNYYQIIALLHCILLTYAGMHEQQAS